MNCDRELDVRCRVDNSKDGKLIRPVREERHEWTHANVGTSRQNKRCHSVTGNGLASNKIGRRCKKVDKTLETTKAPGIKHLSVESLADPVIFIISIDLVGRWRRTYTTFCPTHQKQSGNLSLLWPDLIRNEKGLVSSRNWSRELPYCSRWRKMARRIHLFELGSLRAVARNCPGSHLVLCESYRSS